MPEMIMIFVVILLLIRANKLPELASVKDALGKEPKES